MYYTLEEIRSRCDYIFYDNCKKLSSARVLHSFVSYFKKLPTNSGTTFNPSIHLNIHIYIQETVRTLYDIYVLQFQAIVNIPSHIENVYFNYPK